ncbi:MAG: bifunctional chorismate mutase/prephenate dehydrogenase [Candidatus Sumerlaeia bacterium]|nr:bifunctional chorismate mutase/prephenate dehydrogenase [Candidatus Sumerlaeia bacterium]
MSADSGLGALREEIDAIDGELLALLARRRGAVERVAAHKKAHGLPVYHPSREEDLITDRRARALAAGLPPDCVEDVFRRLLRESRVQQGRETARHAVRPGARVLLVGGDGAMGRCLRRWFEDAGYEARVLDRGDWPRARTLAAGCDAAIVSVPIDRTESVVAQVSGVLPPECVLADITSVKAGPVRAMLAAHAGPVLGLHPMFGPTTHTLDKQIVVAVEGRAPERCSWLLEQLAAWGAVVMPATAEEHDEAMAVVQALRHFATFAFGQFLERRRVDLRRTLDFSSPIYRLELAMVGRLFAQDPDLYAEIIFATAERRALLAEYAASLHANLPMVEAGDREAFHREFMRIAEWFGPFGDQAIRESTYLIDKLVERF